MTQKKQSQQGERPRTSRSGKSSRPAARRRKQSGAPWVRFFFLAIVAAAVGVIIWQAGKTQLWAAAPAPAPTIVLPSPTPDARDHRVLARPLARTVSRDFADRTYLFGASKSNTYRVHHGLDMVNPTGTVVQAAGDGVVVFAGSDSGTRYGPQTIPNFYGNMVLVKLTQPYRDKDVYYLNGHLDSVAVQTGQAVKAGDVIGRIGMTGTADGPHLHFEVRAGGATYAHSRNPALWMRSLPGSGALAGIVSDKAGKPLPGVAVTIIKDITASDIQKYWGDATTYPNDPLGNLNSDEEWAENFAVGDLPAGLYEVRAAIGGTSYIQRVTVFAGQISWLAFPEGTAAQ